MAVLKSVAGLVQRGMNETGPDAHGARAACSVKDHSARTA